MVYLTKSIGQAAGLDEYVTDAQRDHAHRLHAELRVTPCSPRCAVWLLYGIQPKGARHSMTAGRCKGKAHQPEHLGIAGRRVLVSRKWSNKTLDDHRAERGDFVRQLLQQAGIHPTHGPQDGPYLWERTTPHRPRHTTPTRPTPTRHRRTTTMESRIHRRPTRRKRPTTGRKLFGNSTRGRVTRGNDMGTISSIDRLWTVNDVSTYLGVPVKTLYQWKWRGEGPPVRKVGRYLRYDPATVKRWATPAA